MRLRVWIVLLTAVAALIGGVAVWAVAGGSPRPVLEQAAATAAARGHVPARPSVPARRPVR